MTAPKTANGEERTKVGGVGADLRDGRRHLQGRRANDVCSQAQETGWCSRECYTQWSGRECALPPENFKTFLRKGR